MDDQCRQTCEEMGSRIARIEEKVARIDERTTNTQTDVTWIRDCVVDLRDRQWRDRIAIVLLGLSSGGGAVAILKVLGMA